MITTLLHGKFLSKGKNTLSKQALVDHMVEKHMRTEGTKESYRTACENYSNFSIFEDHLNDHSIWAKNGSFRRPMHDHSNPKWKN